MILFQNNVFFRKLTNLLTISASRNLLLLFEVSNISSKLLPNRVSFDKLTKMMIISASGNPLLFFRPARGPPELFTE